MIRQKHRSDMFPRFVVHDFTDAGLMNIVNLRDVELVFSICISLPNILNGFMAQMRLWLCDIWQVFPVAITDDTVDLTSLYAIHLTKSFLADTRCMEFPNIENLLICQFSSRMVNTLSVPIRWIRAQSSTSDHVLNIVMVGSIQQMARITAWGIIASMAYDASRLTAMFKKKSKPVRLEGFTQYSEVSIPTDVFPSSVFPAKFGRGHINLAPKFLRKVAIHGWNWLTWRSWHIQILIQT